MNSKLHDWKTMIKRSLSTIAFAHLMLAAIIAVPTAASAAGAEQISGSSVYAAPGECADAVGAGSAYALKLSGDLTGCHYVFAVSSRCSPSGAYKESGYEIFVGQLKGVDGSFRTSYIFEAKYADCQTLAIELFGRCQHPLVAGSGVGAFVGTTGRLDFKDEVETGIFYYRGHLRW